MKHLLSIESLSADDLNQILFDSAKMKASRGKTGPRPLEDQIWAMMFSKSSTRTRVSFEVGIRELGGKAIFLSGKEIQLGRGEPVIDTARVLGRMIHGVVFRTFKQEDVELFAEYSKIPTINALTDEEHPCQILADIFTFQEKRESIQGKVVTFFGDGICNVSNSWMFAAAKLGFEYRVAAPKDYQPDAEFLKRVETHRTQGAKIVLTDDVQAAAKGADLLYTDVWISMGREAESEKRDQALSSFQLNQSVVALAHPEALVMHCLPAHRGEEISEETLEANAQTIFDEAENRLHVQKAIIQWLVS